MTIEFNHSEGLGVYQLLDDRSDTYCMFFFNMLIIKLLKGQSDGLQPHTITIEFQRKTDISFVVIYLDYKADESYTPSKIQVQSGSSILCAYTPCFFKLQGLN